ncbi:hypothetical protein MKEN_00493500 [Mycena kentingensis (nom. inval.)]|nr:hypothetical protein MKEN_00493500 [Mycena kentingensis (nom. inval.)]
MAGVELCMSLPISCVLGPQTQSFEEVRMQDYLKAYQTTGRPPPPVPQYPADATSRTAQGLPPLFVPAPFPDAGGATTTSLFGATTAASTPSTSSAPAITDPAKLPIAQTFTPLVQMNQGERETYMTISVAAEYANWSPDELRYYAYLRGTRQPPPGTTMMPFLQPPSVAASSSSSSAAGVPTGVDGEQLMSISARPEFAGHSFEELRVAYLRAGTELNSAQITGNAPVQQQNSVSMAMTPASNPVNPLTTPGVVSPFAAPTFGAVPAAPAPSVFGGFGATPAPTPPTGAFSFGQPQQPPAQGGFSFGAARF